MLAFQIPSLKGLGVIFNSSGVMVRKGQKLNFGDFCFNFYSEALFESWRSATCVQSLCLKVDKLLLALEGSI